MNISHKLRFISVEFIAIWVSATTLELLFSHIRCCVQEGDLISVFRSVAFCIAQEDKFPSIYDWSGLISSSASWSSSDLPVDSN